MYNLNLIAASQSVGQLRERVVALETQLNDKTVALEQVQAAYCQKAEEVTSLKTQILNMKGEQDRARMELTAAQTGLAELKAQVQDMRVRLKAVAIRQLKCQT